MSVRRRWRGWAHLLVAGLLAALATGLVVASAESAPDLPEPPTTTPQVVTVAPPPAPAHTEATEGPAVVAADVSEVVVPEPVRVVIPAIGVDAPVVPVALTADGALDVPDFGLAGWYRLGPRPGEPGPAVIAGHVDSRAGPDVFYRLRELPSGALVAIHDAEGAVHQFTVSAVEQHDKDQLPADRIWSDDDTPVLRLITCGGTFDRSVRHYTDNVVVFAEAR